MSFFNKVITTVFGKKSDKDLKKLNPFINEINDEMNIDIPEGRYETLAGFIIDRLQSIPEKNTTTNYKGYRFTILETSKNKISKIQIRILSMPSRKNVEN